ncbi:MAG: hypothetical protein CVV55_00040 [Synergistetes bacterium HGW-Synergistetes-2]|nr:MAG: hypothetical protein CVV55_00040 [Synergistetes bacterium HGW-Synergistetes-2]
MSVKRFLYLVTALLVLLGGTAHGEARLSGTLLDLGYDRAVRVDGADAAFSAFFPVPALSRLSGEMLWKLAPSPALIGNGSFSFFLNDRLVLTRSVDSLRKEPLVRLPVPADLPVDRFLHARIESRIGITDDLCRDLFSGQLFWTVLEDSGFVLDDVRIPHRSVSDFFQTLFGSLRILLPRSPSKEEAESAVWIAAMLRKVVPGLSVVLEMDDNVPSESVSFIRIAGDSGALPPGVGSLPGISLLGKRGLLVLGDGTPGSLRGFVKAVASFPLFAAIPSRSILPATSEATEEKPVSNMLSLAEGTGVNTVYLEIPVFPGLLASPPQDLSFQLEGAFTLPWDPARPARLDIYWNGVFIESEYLPASGRFSKRLLLPVETPLLTENRLRIDVSYHVDEGMCRYRSAENRATLLPSSSFHGYGKYPLHNLSWNSFGIFALRKGVLLLEEPFSIEGIRSAADMLHWLGGRYPRDVFLFPDLRTFHSLCNHRGCGSCHRPGISSGSCGWAKDAKPGTGGHRPLCRDLCILPAP